MSDSNFVLQAQLDVDLVEHLRESFEQNGFLDFASGFRAITRFESDQSEDLVDDSWDLLR